MATVNLGQIKPVFKGAYNNSTAYVLDNIVTSSGSSYICILASTGNAVSNATYWSSLATGASVSASDLTAGTLPDGRFPATLPAASAANLTAVPAANITGTLPAISGANLTGISTGITHASSFKLPSSVTITTNNTWTDITAWTDLAGSNHAPDVGAAVTHSSGIFSFPVTGLWMITGSVGQGYGNTKRRMILNCRGTSDNSSYSEMGRSI